MNLMFFLSVFLFLLCLQISFGQIASYSFEVNLNDEASFDAFFVKTVHKLNVKTMNFGDAKFVNPSMDENIAKLWNDLELNGKGLILNVNKELIN